MARKKAKNLEGQLLKVLKDESTAAEKHYSTGVSQEQEMALKRYLGEALDGDDKVKGASKAISKDVAQVVDAALPDLIEPFVAGDNVVEFTADEQVGEEQAKEETIACNHVFSKDNNGIMLLHDAIKDALIQKRGHLKVYWEEKDKIRKRKLPPMPVEQLAAFQMQHGEAEQEGITFETEQDEQGMFYVTVRQKKKVGKCCIEVIPPEEFLISPTVKNEDTEEVGYKAHRRLKTRSELIKEGFDKKKVNQLASSEAPDETTDNERDRFVEQNPTNVSSDKSKDRFVLYEEYVHTDMDEDGIAELVRVYRVNDTILDFEEVKEDPFVTGEAIRLPHTFYGESLADKTMSIQSVKTGMVRAMNDNVAMNVRPRVEIPEGAERRDGSTMDDLLSVEIGRPIRTASSGMLNAIVTPNLTAGLHNAMEYYDYMREQDSGITRNTMGLSADVIDKSEKSATEAANVHRGANARKRLMVRIIAETMVRPLFMKVRSTLIEYQQEPREIRTADEKYTQFDPSSWQEDTSAKMDVGLGHNDKSEKMMSIQAVAQAQAEAAQLGLVGKREFYNTASDLVDAAGLGNVGRYFIEPQEGDEELPQPPDPKQIEAEAKMQIEGQKLQASQQNDQVKAQLDREQAEADYQLKRDQMEAEFALKQEQMAAEFALKQAEMQAEIALKKQINSQSGDTGGSVRFGGKVG